MNPAAELRMSQANTVRPSSGAGQTGSAGLPERDVLIVGGGISGLTVAWHLRRAGIDVALVESRTDVGGSIATEHRDGFLLEKGPFNVIVRDPAFEELLAGVADRVKVVSADPAAHKRYIYRHGGLIEAPSGPGSLLTTGLLSRGGKLRALRGLALSARGTNGEPTIAEFATRRFGPEVAETLVSAAVAGILAGDIHRLSAYACFPVLEEFDRHSFSPLGRTLRRVPNMIRKRRNPALRRKWRGLVSIDHGLGGLCAALAESLGPGLFTGRAVDSIHQTAGGFALTTHKAVLNGDQMRATAPADDELRCRRLILATPAHETARLLAPHCPAAAGLLGSIESASLTVVNLGFRRQDVGHPLDGFGFLVPDNEPEFPLLGVLWADSAFPHHAAPDRRLLRVFFGGARRPELALKPGDELVRIACTHLKDLLQVRGEPLLVDVCPYPSAIPQYYLGHAAKVAEIRGEVGRIPGLALAGNYLAGVSINDCVKLGKQVALSLIENTEMKVGTPAK